MSTNSRCVLRAMSSIYVEPFSRSLFSQKVQSQLFDGFVNSSLNSIALLHVEVLKLLRYPTSLIQKFRHFESHLTEIVICYHRLKLMLLHAKVQSFDKLVVIGFCNLKHLDIKEPTNSHLK